MIDWTVWMPTTLEAYAPLVAVIPADAHFGGGSLDKAPSMRPFLVIQFGGERPSGKGQATITDGEIYLHDEPGSYMSINEALRHVRAAVEGAPRAVDMTEARWQGDSANLADDKFGTIMRYASFRLIGRTT